VPTLFSVIHGWLARRSKRAAVVGGTELED
jgi:hypothetical protein